MDERTRELQKKVIITVAAMIVVRFLLTRGFGTVRIWWQRRSAQREELDKLQSRRNDSKAQKEELELELAEEEKREAERKKDKNGKKGKSTTSQQKATFQFPKAAAPAEGEAVETRKAAAPAPATKRATAPSRASNPWANEAPAPTPAPVPAPASAAWTDSSFAAERRAQDAEYEASLAVDNARKEQKAEGERKAQMASVVQKSLRDALPSDPGEESGEELIHIAFKLIGHGVRDGVKFTRRFRRNKETTTDVINFWKAHGLVEPEDMNRIDICTSYPGHSIEPDQALSEFSPKEAFVVRLK